MEERESEARLAWVRLEGGVGAGGGEGEGTYSCVESLISLQDIGQATGSSWIECFSCESHGVGVRCHAKEPSCWNLGGMIVAIRLFVFSWYHANIKSS